METAGERLKIRKSDYLEDYLRIAPISLSLIRAAECGMLSALPFTRPVLDLGCGDGLFVKVLFDDMVDCGIDISPREISLAKSSGRYRELVVSRAEALPYPDNHFNTVFSNCVVEHLGKLNETFSEVCRVLRPGGKFYCTTHSDYYEDYFFYSSLFRGMGFDKLARSYSGFWRDLWQHHNCFPASEWKTRLKNAGFAHTDAVPYLGKSAVFAFDLLLPVASMSYFVRKLTGRWKLFPRRLSMRPAKGFAQMALDKGITGEWCYLLKATKG
jgi:SAM-dependent methyltransferase